VSTLLIALPDRPAMATLFACCIWVFYVAEGYFLTPIMECRAVVVPPALTIMMQVLMWFLAGAQRCQHTSHTAGSAERAARFSFSIALPNERRSLMRLSSTVNLSPMSVLSRKWACSSSRSLYELAPMKPQPITTAFMTALWLDRGISKLLASFATSVCDPERRKLYIVRHQWADHNLRRRPPVANTPFREEGIDTGGSSRDCVRTSH
jgi:hypothetical protein